MTRKKTFRRIFSYPIGCEKKALSDILASSLSWKNSKHVKAGLKLKLKFKSARFYSWLRIFRDTSLSIHVFVNKNCCHFKCFIEIIFLALNAVKISCLSLCELLFSVVHEHRMQEYSKCHVYLIKLIWCFKSKRILRPLPTSVHSNTDSLHCKFGAWQNSYVAGRTGDLLNH